MRYKIAKICEAGAALCLIAVFVCLMSMMWQDSRFQLDVKRPLLRAVHSNLQHDAVAQMDLALAKMPSYGYDTASYWYRNFKSARDTSASFSGQWVNQQKRLQLVILGGKGEVVLSNAPISRDIGFAMICIILAGFTLYVVSEKIGPPVIWD